MSSGRGESDPLLVVVDMQGIFADPQSPWCTPGYHEIVEPVGRLVEAFGDRVVFTRFILPERLEGSWLPYYEQWKAVTEPAARPLFELTEPWARAHPRTLDKTTFSKWGPELEAMAGEGRTLILCGVATDCCVIATALPAADAGMFVRVVSDACRGVDEAAHQRALGLAAGFAPQITLTTVKEERVRLKAMTGARRAG